LHTCSKYRQRLYDIVVSLQISLRTRFVNKFVLAYCYTKREHHISYCATNYLLDLIGRYLLRHSADVVCSGCNRQLL